jgi:hypothetical protein
MAQEMKSLAPDFQQETLILGGAGVTQSQHDFAAPRQKLPPRTSC